MLFECYNLFAHSILRDILQRINEFQPLILGDNQPSLMEENDYTVIPTD